MSGGGGERERERERPVKSERERRSKIEKRETIKNNFLKIPTCYINSYI